MRGRWPEPGARTRFLLYLVTAGSREPVALLVRGREDRRILSMFSAILGLTDDVNDQDFINFWSSCLGRTRSGAILKLRDVSAVDDELITIGRVHRHGEPHWRTRLVVRSPEYLENAYPAVRTVIQSR